MISVTAQYSKYPVLGHNRSHYHKNICQYTENRMLEDETSDYMKYTSDN